MSERWPMFDIKRDNAIIEAGGFWCSGCLCGKSAGEQSLDSRFCRGCYDFLMMEYQLIKESGRPRHPSWVPRAATETTTRVGQGVEGLRTNEERVSGDGSLEKAPEMASLGNRKSYKVTAEITAEVYKLAAEGLGADVISRQLGGVISSRTVSRLLAAGMKATKDTRLLQ